jgi:hypothetical protein
VFVIDNLQRKTGKPTFRIYINSKFCFSGLPNISPISAETAHFCRATLKNGQNFLFDKSNYFLLLCTSLYVADFSRQLAGSQHPVAFV